MPFAAQLKGQQPLDFANFFEATLGLQLESLPTQNALNTPVLLCHTSDDEIVDVELGRQARDVLEEMGMVVTWTEHQEGGHLAFLATKGLDDIVEFLQGIYGDGRRGVDRTGRSKDDRSHDDMASNWRNRL